MSKSAENFKFPEFCSEHHYFLNFLCFRTFERNVVLQSWEVLRKRPRILCHNTLWATGITMMKKGGSKNIFIVSHILQSLLALLYNLFFKKFWFIVLLTLYVLLAAPMILRDWHRSFILLDCKSLTCLLTKSKQCLKKVKKVSFLQNCDFGAKFQMFLIWK